MDAFKLASSIRYVDDVKLNTYSPDPSLVNKIQAGLALNSLKISKETTPELFNCLESTCENLFLDINMVSAYVTSSPEIQASCISFNKDSCIITLTSAVINLLNFEEIKFVIGHELGHFLLSHNIEEQHTAESLEGYIKTRAQEISVDRIGLLACRDINVATRSITKSLSGLDEKYISTNMHGFLAQLDLDVASNDDSGRYSSHPSFILRLKSLIRFSMSDAYLIHTNNTHGINIKEVDALIQNDMNIFIDKEIRKEINDAKDMVFFWSYAFAYIREGVFSKADQKIISDKFGPEMKDKLIKMLQSLTRANAIEEVQNKLIKAINDFKIAAPNTSKKELNLYLMQIEDESKQQGLFKEIMKII